MSPADLQSMLDAVPVEMIPTAIIRLAARAMVPAQPPTPAQPKASAEKSLTAEQAAQRLGVSVRWIYRHAAQLGAVRLSARTLRVPERALDRYLVRRRNGH